MAQDTIERQMQLKASRDKVWDALTQPEKMTRWFSSSIDVTTLSVGQEFRLGWSDQDEYSRGIVVEMTPKTRFAYRWEDSQGDKSKALSDTPTTLVVFELADTEGGTRLTMIESGIAAMPNMAQIFAENSHGWDSELAELQAFAEAV